MTAITATMTDAAETDGIITREQMPRLFDGNVTLGRLSMLHRTRSKIDAQLARKGPVVCASVDAEGRAMLLTNDAGVAQAVMDERLFTKHVTKKTTLQWEVRSLLGDSMLTASTDDDVWRRARAMMNPLFAKQATQLHFGAMCSAATKASKVLATHADAGSTLDLMPFAVCATLHSILLALFGHCSDLYAAQPSLDAALSTASQAVLEESVARTYYPRIVNRLRRSDQTWRKTERTFHTRMAAFIRQRTAGDDDGTHGQDILQCLLDAGMGKDNAHLIQQLMLLIIAGHETTGSSMAYLLYTLAQHPDVQERVALEAQQAGLDVDDLTGVDVSALSRLPYTDMVINESMRMNPSATVVLRVARHDQTVTATDGRRFAVRKGDLGSVMLSALHNNAGHWPAPHTFRPQRFAKDVERHAYAFLPFAAGARSCLGRAIALQEMRLFTAVFCHRFHVRRRAASSMWTRSMRHYYGFTMKPLHAHVVVQRRTAVAVAQSSQSSTPTLCRSSMEHAAAVQKHSVASTGTALPSVHVAYGSNHGQCRAMAFELQQLLARLGFEAANEPCALDAVVDARLTPDSLLFIVTSTYNGAPPDNAVHFCKSLHAATWSPPHGVQFAVFGAGNAEWRATLHAFPRLVDASLAAGGTAQRFLPLGVGDADDNLDGDWRAWLTSLVAHLTRRFPGCSARAHEAAFVQALATGCCVASLDVEWLPLSTSVAEFGRDDAHAMPITSIKELQQTAISGRSTLRVTLDTHTAPYEPGDHLLVWPQNPPDIVDAIASALAVDVCCAVVVRPTNASAINPALAAAHIGRPTTVRDVLRHHVDLLCRPTRSMVANVCQLLQRRARYAQADALAAALDDDAQWHRCTTQHARTVAALCLYVATLAPAALTFADWLAVWPRMQARSYSLASDARGSAHILVSIQDHGQIGAMLRRSTASVFAAVRPSTFRLAHGHQHAVMIAAGTGLAPFMSFLQRIKHDAASRPSQSTTLVYGSRGPFDVLCADELHSYRNDGTLTELLLAQSRVDGHGARYVGDCIRNNADAMAAKLQDPNAVFYLCGASSTMAANALEALHEVLQTQASMSSEQARRHIAAMRSNGTLREDTWG